MRARFRRKSGFTLMEVMVSLLLIAATGTMFYGMLPTAAKTGKMQGNYQQASSIVQHKIDQVRGVGYGRLNYDDLLAAGIIDASPNASPYSFKTVDGVASIFKTCTATMDVADFNAKVKQVTVTLTWTAGPNKPSNGTMTVVALVAKS
jgi:prepilin-type N-terminal cleavage/methylation domain-containing protein